MLTLLSYLQGMLSLERMLNADAVTLPMVNAVAGEDADSSG